MCGSPVITARARSPRPGATSKLTVPIVGLLKVCIFRERCRPGDCCPPRCRPELVGGNIHRYVAPCPSRMVTNGKRKFTSLTPIAITFQPMEFAVVQTRTWGGGSFSSGKRALSILIRSTLNMPARNQRGNFGNSRANGPGEQSNFFPDMVYLAIRVSIMADNHYFLMRLSKRPQGWMLLTGAKIIRKRHTRSPESCRICSWSRECSSRSSR
jgi:hypothetical protein